MGRRRRQNFRITLVFLLKKREGKREKKERKKEGKELNRDSLN